MCQRVSWSAVDLDRPALRGYPRARRGRRRQALGCRRRRRAGERQWAKEKAAIVSDGQMIARVLRRGRCKDRPVQPRGRDLGTSPRRRLAGPPCTDTPCPVTAATHARSNLPARAEGTSRLRGHCALFSRLSAAARAGPSTASAGPAAAHSAQARTGSMPHVYAAYFQVAGAAFRPTREPAAWNANTEDRGYAGGSHECRRMVDVISTDAVISAGASPSHIKVTRCRHT